MILLKELLFIKINSDVFIIASRTLFEYLLNCRINTFSVVSEVIEAFRLMQLPLALIPHIFSYTKRACVLAFNLVALAFSERFIG